MAEGLIVNERGEIQGSGTSAAAQAIGFVTEFNQNAQIFEEEITEEAIMPEVTPTQVESSPEPEETQETP